MIQCFQYRDGVSSTYDFQAIILIESLKGLTDNMVAVNIFPSFPNSEKTEEKILEYIRSYPLDHGTTIVFDNVHEGHVTSCLTSIYRVIKDLDHPRSSIVFLTGALDATEIHQKFVKTNNIDQPIQIVSAVIWERHLGWDKHRPEPQFVPNLKKKLFLCFNRMSRKHRIALLALMDRFDLVNKSYYSFFSGSYGTSLRHILSSMKDDCSRRFYNMVCDQFLTVLDKLPLVLNMESQTENPNHQKETDREYYDNSYFSLVTETFFFRTPTHGDPFYDEIGIFFSEKAFKPIFSKHPFILVSRPHSLEYLKRLGYKTFAPLINEGYDAIVNDEIRMLAIADEVQRLSKQTPEEWQAWQEMVQERVEYNYRVFMSKTEKDHQYFPENNSYRS